MKMVKGMEKKDRKPGRPRAIPKAVEPLVVKLHDQGYGYRAIARILQSPEYGLNPHYSSVRQTLMRLGKVVKR